MSDCLRKKTGNGKFHPWYQQYFKHVKASRHVRYLKIGKTNLNLYIVSKLRQISSPYLSKYYQTRLIFSRVQIFGFNIKMKALTFAILFFFCECNVHKNVIRSNQNIRIRDSNSWKINRSRSKNQYNKSELTESLL